MSTLGDLGLGDSNLYTQDKERELTPEAEKYSDIGTLQSIFAGLGSGRYS